MVDRLYPGTRRLVFVDSRRRVEELGHRLAQRGVDVYLSHSSLALSERTAAEKAFKEGSNCVIVATSALELGIDVGDLDHVIQIDAPISVSSFLQRMGRTGRRPGTRAKLHVLGNGRRVNSAGRSARCALPVWLRRTGSAGHQDPPLVLRRECPPPRLRRHLHILRHYRHLRVHGIIPSRPHQ
jgi:ATP-dependent helicase YprA (DUF1998 family)